MWPSHRAANGLPGKYSPSSGVKATSEAVDHDQRRCTDRPSPIIALADGEVGFRSQPSPRPCRYERSFMMQTFSDWLRFPCMSHQGMSRVYVTENTAFRINGQGSRCWESTKRGRSSSRKEQWREKGKAARERDICRSERRAVATADAIPNAAASNRNQPALNLV